MVSDQQQNNALGQLDAVIDQTVSHISDFTKNPSDFTRNRKLNASTTIKVTLNMQGNSLNTELIEAFPNLDDRMTASAYEQQKDKLTPELFQHIFEEYNKSLKKAARAERAVYDRIIIWNFVFVVISTAVIMFYVNKSNKKLLEAINNSKETVKTEKLDKRNDYRKSTKKVVKKNHEEV